MNRVGVYVKFEVVRRWKGRVTRLVILFVIPAELLIDGVILVKSRWDETRWLLSYRMIDLSFEKI